MAVSTYECESWNRFGKKYFFLYIEGASTNVFISTKTFLLFCSLFYLSLYVCVWFINSILKRS